eukprot:2733888-Prymnesium_polylepis.1
MQSTSSAVSTLAVPSQATASPVLQEEAGARRVRLHKVWQLDAALVGGAPAKDAAHVLGDRRAQRALPELPPVDVLEELVAHDLLAADALVLVVVHQLLQQALRALSLIHISEPTRRS